MKDLIILQGITKEELFLHIETVIESKLKRFIEDLPKEKAFGYLTRKEAAALLRISLVTLGELTKEQIIESTKIGNRVLYRSDFIEIYSRNYKKGIRNRARRP